MSVIQLLAAKTCFFCIGTGLTVLFITLATGLWLKHLFEKDEGQMAATAQNLAYSVEQTIANLVNEIDLVLLSSTLAIFAVGRRPRA